MAELGSLRGVREGFMVPHLSRQKLSSPTDAHLDVKAVSERIVSVSWLMGRTCVMGGE